MIWKAVEYEYFAIMHFVTWPGHIVTQWRTQAVIFVNVIFYYSLDKQYFRKKLFKIYFMNTWINIALIRHKSNAFPSSEFWIR